MQKKLYIPTEWMNDIIFVNSIQNNLYWNVAVWGEYAEQ